MGVYVDGTPLEAFQEIGRGIRSKMREMMDASTFTGNVLLGFRGRIAEDDATLTLVYANGDDAIHSDDVSVRTIDDIFTRMEADGLFVCSEIYSPCLLEDTSGVIFYYEDDSQFVLQNFLSLFGNLIEKRGDDSAGDKFLEYKENHSVGWADGFHVVGQADVARKAYVEWIGQFRDDFVGARHVDFIYNERNWRSDFCALIPAQDKDELADCLELDAGWDDDKLVLTSGEEPLDDGTPPFRRDVLNLPVLVEDFGVFVGAKSAFALSDYIGKYREVSPRLLGGFTCDVFRAVVNLSLKN